MKNSLKQRIEAMLERMIQRCDMLESNAKEYAAALNYADAAICKTKAIMLKLVIVDIQKQLLDSL